MLSVHCPNCGGTSTFDETKQVPTFCMFCGAHLPDMNDYVQKALRLGLDKQYHNMDLEKLDKEIKKEKTKSTPDIMLIIMGIVFAVFAIYMVSKIYR